MQQVICFVSLMSFSHHARQARHSPSISSTECISSTKCISRFRTCEIISTRSSASPSPPYGSNAHCVRSVHGGSKPPPYNRAVTHRGAKPPTPAGISRAKRISNLLCLQSKYIAPRYTRHITRRSRTSSRSDFIHEVDFTRRSRISFSI